MAFTDFEVWVPDEFASGVIQEYNKGSAVERVARPEPLKNIKDVPRDGGFDVAGVAKGAAYAEGDNTGDVVTLRARKAGGIHRFAVEDINDSPVDLLATKRQAAAVSLSKFFDNATLGATGAENGTTRLYTSVYQSVRSNDAAVSYTANTNYRSGSVTFANLNDTLSIVESGDWADEIIWIAHPAFKGLVRGLVDSNGTPLLANVTVDGMPRDMLLGYPVEWSLGARVSATNTDKPTGNPFAVVTNRNLLIKGVSNLPGLSGGVPGYALQGPAQGDGFDDDTAKMKAALRRGFAVGNVNGVALFEKTA